MRCISLPRATIFVVAAIPARSVSPTLVRVDLMIITHNIHLIPPLSVERISRLCSNSRNRVSLTHKLSTCIIRCLLAIFLENECILRHWLFTRASQHYNNRHHPCQFFLLCVSPPSSHLGMQEPHQAPISHITPFQHDLIYIQSNFPSLT